MQNASIASHTDPPAARSAALSYRVTHGSGIPQQLLEMDRHHLMNPRKETQNRGGGAREAKREGYELFVDRDNNSTRTVTMEARRSHVYSVDTGVPHALRQESRVPTALETRAQTPAVREDGRMAGWQELTSQEGRSSLLRGWGCAFRGAGRARVGESTTQDYCRVLCSGRELRLTVNWFSASDDDRWSIFGGEKTQRLLEREMDGGGTRISMHLGVCRCSTCALLDIEAGSHGLLTITSALLLGRYMGWAAGLSHSCQIISQMNLLDKLQETSREKFLLRLGTVIGRLAANSGWAAPA